MPESVKLNGTQLKIFAALIMVVDHIGAVIFPQYRILRIIGRISFPIFCFLMAEGMYHTSDIRKYMLRLFVAAFITEPVFNLAFSGTLNCGSHNVMFTFGLAAMAVWLGRKIDKKGNVGLVLMAAAAAFAAEYLHTDYGAYGILLIMIFYTFRENRLAAIIWSGAFQAASGGSIQVYSVFSLIPILLYNGKRGSGIKYFFYVFYPGHLLILFLVAKCLGIY